MWAEIISKSPYAVMVISQANQLITYANNAAIQAFYPAPLLGARFEDFLHAEDLKSFHAASSLTTSRMELDVNLELIEESKETFRAEIVRVLVTEGTILYLRRLDDHALSTGQFTVALFDPLTGLPNRELLRDRAEQAIHTASRLDQNYLGILFVDLDHFKKVNDSFGHALGDAVLIEVAKRLRNCIRETDTVSRLGGDEFVVLLCNLRQSPETAIVAERILDECSRPIVVGQNVFQISASVGVAVWPADGKTVDDLLHSADLAMYSSKGEGRNTLRFYNEQMNERAKTRARVEAELKVALRDGHFILHYQPQFCSRTHRIIGAEALIRWYHPTQGLIPPAQFIQIAEETNLITPIGDWVLREAVKQGREWKRLGLDLRVAVNLSGRQFVESLPAVVSEVLASSDFPAELLELELTESFLVSDTDKAARIIHELRGLGVRVALDDFGTGFSSLTYLKSFPVDTLKIDRSFIGSPASGVDERMVRAILSIAREFNLSTLAEGVETDEQLASLHALGCDVWQGFLLSSAIPAEEVPAFYEQVERQQGRFTPIEGAR